MYTFEPDRRLLILSDLHIGDGTRSDPFRKRDTHFVRFLQRMTPRVDGIVLVGDILDDLQARPRARMRKAHAKAMDAIEEAARTIPVVWLPGNHDRESWEDGALANVLYSKEAHIGTSVRILHGDVYDPFYADLDWSGRIHAALERVTGCPLQLPLERHDNIPNRFMHWFIAQFTRVFRALASFVTARLGDRLGLEKNARLYDEYFGRAMYGDVNGLLAGVLRDLEAGPYRVIICGHSHTPGVIRFPIGCYANPGSWVHGESTYALYRNGRVRVMDWKKRCRIGAGLYRRLLKSGTPSLEEWWQKHYRGWLQFELRPEKP